MFVVFGWFISAVDRNSGILNHSVFRGGELAYASGGLDLGE
jgi:hypothetical protein